MKYICKGLLYKTQTHNHIILAALYKKVAAKYVSCLKLMSKENNRSWWRGILAATVLASTKFVCRKTGHPWVTHLLLWDALVFVASVYPH